MTARQQRGTGGDSGHLRQRSRHAVGTIDVAVGIGGRSVTQQERRPDPLPDGERREPRLLGWAERGGRPREGTSRRRAASPGHSAREHPLVIAGDGDRVEGAQTRHACFWIRTVADQIPADEDAVRVRRSVREDRLQRRQVGVNVSEE